jgi:hypothetical protein
METGMTTRRPEMCDTEQIKLIFLFNIRLLSAGMSKGTHSQEWVHEREARQKSFFTFRRETCLQITTPARTRNMAVQEAIAALFPWMKINNAKLPARVEKRRMKKEVRMSLSRTKRVKPAVRADRVAMAVAPVSIQAPVVRAAIRHPALPEAVRRSSMPRPARKAARAAMMVGQVSTQRGGIRIKVAKASLVLPGAVLPSSIPRLAVKAIKIPDNRL